MADHSMTIICLKFNITLLIQVLKIHFYCFYFLHKIFSLNTSRSVIILKVINKILFIHSGLQSTPF